MTVQYRTIMKEIIYFLAVCSIIGVCSANSDVAIEDYPYQVSIKSLFGRTSQRRKHKCNGAILDETHVLTVASCVTGKDSRFSQETSRILAGTNTSVRSDYVYEIANVIVHPEYDARKLHNNIAVVKLSEPIEFNDSQQPVELTSQAIKIGSEGTATTYGIKDGKYVVPAVGLKTIRQTLMDGKKCTDFIKGEIQVIDTEICGYHDGRYDNGERTGFCNGDSGAPLLVDNKLVGIGSHTVKAACGSGLPDIYTNVYAYLDFIKESVKN